MAKSRSGSRTAAFQGKPRKILKRRTPLLVTLILFGLFCFFAFVVSPLLQWSAADEWTRTDCRVIHAGVVSRNDDWEHELRYTWSLAGRTYEGDRIGFVGGVSTSDPDGAKSYTVGSTIPCWVDPTRPDRAVLDRTLPTTAILVAFVASALFTIGGIGGLLRGKVYEDELDS